MTAQATAGTTAPVFDTAAPPARFGAVRRFFRLPLVRLLIAIFMVAGCMALADSTHRLLPAAVRPLLIAAGSIVGYWLYVRLVERRRPTELTGRGSVTGLFAGLACGALLFSLTVGLLALLGVFSIAGSNAWTVALPVLATAVMSGVSEELLSRAVVFRIFEEWLGSWIALAISAVAFGAMHLGNPDATLFNALAIGLEAGVMLAAAYMLTRNVWFATGIHIAWNFTQGGVFGIATSGFETNGWLQGRLQGPTLLSGGGFGAEASIVAVLVCTLAGIALLTWAIRRGHLVAPSWRRKALAASTHVA